MKESEINNGKDDPVVAQMQKRIKALRARYDELSVGLAEITPELKRYERALMLVLDEVPPKGPIPAPKPTGKRKYPRYVGEDKLGEIEDAIRAYAADHDEFRQVDIRTVMDNEAQFGSNTMTIAFEQLRQRGVIRFARKDGNSKCFRLTAEALREQS
jgi:hypothetical protein